MMSQKTQQNLLMRAARRLWTMTLGEESWVRRNGDFRTLERHGLVARPNYAYGMLRAADMAKYFGKRRVTVVEFGVASGWGLLNMISLAPQIEKETGVQLDIFGFDTGAGLPPLLEDYRDHPELWRQGDFAMEDQETLVRKLDGRAQIIWGDIKDTVGPFVEKLTDVSPLGFVSVDVDIYTATKSALRCLDGSAEKYTPAVSMYFDDIWFYFANSWAGQLAAIEEFNQEHELRKLDQDRGLPGSRPNVASPWYRAMYVCHLLDHPERRKPADRGPLTIGEHHEFMRRRALY